MIDKTSSQIICTSGCKGKCHDFKLLKESRVRFQKGTFTLLDSGYQGIDALHSNALIPKKKTKYQSLTDKDKDKQYNRALSSQRVQVENIIGWIKRFRIIADQYRNRRKRFGLRFNLIAGIYNYELQN